MWERGVISIHHISITPLNDIMLGPILFSIGMVWILISAVKINLIVHNIDWIGCVLAIIPGWFLVALIFNLLMSWFG